MTLRSEGSIGGAMIRGDEIEGGGPRAEGHEDPSLDEVRSSLARLLASRTFRDVEAQKSFIRYTIEETLQGRGDLLKEYSIGIEALKKKQSFDPRSDPIVRVQAGKLRSRLTRYYQSEGRNDPLRIEFPKGSYRPIFCPAALSEPPPVAALRGISAPTTVSTLSGSDPHSDTPQARPISFHLAESLGQTSRRSRFQILTVAALLIAVFGWGYTTLHLRNEQANARIRADWSPELQELWAPFVKSNRPAVLSIGAPLFVQMRSDAGLAYNFREMRVNRWDDVQNSRIIVALRRLLGNPDLWPSYWVQMGDVEAAFSLGKYLAPRIQNFSFDRSSHFSWEQAANNNMILIGSASVLRELLKEMPVEQQLTLEDYGVRNLYPGKGEEMFLPEQSYSYGYDGEGYALVSRTPGPQGKGDVGIFISNSSAGRLAAVQWFTDPALARSLLGHLRKPSGQIPQYYQVVLRVKYRDLIPIATSYVLHHEVRAVGRAAASN